MRDANSRGGRASRSVRRHVSRSSVRAPRVREKEAKDPETQSGPSASAVARSRGSSRKSKDLLIGLVNDLEGPAFEIRKDLGTLRADIELKLGRPVRMSGSGSSLFTLYDERGEAEAAANVIAASFGVPRTLAAEMTPTLNDDLVAGTNNDAPPPR